MKQEIREKIEELRKKAEELKIYSKAKKVAYIFGEKHSKNYGAWHIYQDKIIWIGWDDYGLNMSIYVKDLFIEENMVCVYDKSITNVSCFRPDMLVGAWIDHLNTLSEKVEEKEFKEELSKKSKQKIDLYEKWGIKVDEI